MSTRTQDTGIPPRLVDSVAQSASKAASLIDDRIHRGADAVSDMAHQTADNVGKASDYVWRKSERLRERASGAAEFANQHPIYTLVSVGLIGVSLGFLLRGSRSNL